MKRCSPPGDLKPCIVFSRLRNGRWLFSALLLRPLCDQWSRPCATSRFRRGVGPQLIRDDTFRNDAVSLDQSQQKSLCRAFVESRLENLVQSNTD